MSYALIGTLDQTQSWLGSAVGRRTAWLFYSFSRRPRRQFSGRRGPRGTKRGQPCAELESSSQPAQVASLWAYAVRVPGRTSEPTANRNGGSFASTI